MSLDLHAPPDRVLIIAYPFKSTLILKCKVRKPSNHLVVVSQVVTSIGNLCHCGQMMMQNPYECSAQVVDFPSRQEAILLDLDLRRLG